MRIVLIAGEAEAGALAGVDAVVRVDTAEEVAAAFEQHEVAQILLGSGVDAETKLAVVRHAVLHHQANREPSRDDEQYEVEPSDRAASL